MFEYCRLLLYCDEVEWGCEDDIDRFVGGRDEVDCWLMCEDLE